MKKLLAMALCLVAVSGYAQKGKEKIAADFYGVDYSCVDVKGADEEPGAFIKAFEAINRLFLSEPKKYDVAGFTGIDILSTSVEQANESLGALAAEQFTSIVAKVYGGDYKYAAMLTVVSTLLAVITTPFYMWVLRG